MSGIGCDLHRGREKEGHLVDLSVGGALSGSVGAGWQLEVGHEVEQGTCAAGWHAVSVEEIELDYTGRSPRAAPMRIDDGSRIARYAEAFPETFAGQWLERDAAGTRVVAFTDSPEQHRAALRSLVFAPDKLRVIQLRYSRQHLLTLTHNIVSMVGSREGLTSWGPDVKSNRVVVHVLRERIGEVRRILMETHPDDVRVEPAGRYGAFEAVPQGDPGTGRPRALQVTSRDEVPERITRALELWASFPIDEEPRPVVLLDSRVKARAFPDGKSKRAFLNGAIEPAPGFPLQVFEAMGVSRRGSPDTVLLLTDATLEKCEFATDRGRRPLPAWRVRAKGVPEPIWVLDPAFEGSMWEPTDTSMGHRPQAAFDGTATRRGDGCTITMAFAGTPAAYADYPGARVFQNVGAVAILPIEVDKIPPEQPRAANSETREVTVVLSEPLGERVLLNPWGAPVMVEG